ncbi:MAG: SLBB domain-containing protein [Bacteroidales bacterium]|nr:SLBB domain-containing protein [Bacteroidales bacterium]
MTDTQVVDYITQGIAAGKTERQIGNELLSKGVSTSQLQQLMRSYRASGSSTTGASASGIDADRGVRKAAEVDNLQQAGSAQGEGGQTTKRPHRGSPDKVLKPGETGTFWPLYDEDGYRRIYGQDIFSSQRLSFEPNQNLATPEDYVLGPGDQLIIDIWGVNEVTIKQTISPDGVITVTQIGPINLSGLTIKEAKGKLKSVLSKTYSSLRNGSSQISVSLGEVRTIQVNVMGEVESPGTYRLSSFSTVFNALYRAGGVTDIGSLRNVRVLRAGKEIATVDVYDYIFNGRPGSDFALKEGDVVNVPPYGKLVSIEGFVKRPMFYEMKDGEPVSSLIGYAGGFSDGAWKEEVHVERNDGRTNHIYTVKTDDFDSFVLMDGDAATVGGSDIELFTNRVEVRGAVYRPGKFQIGGDIATVKQLVEHSGGLLPDAFLGRAQLIREKADRSREMLSVPLKGIMEGLVEDILLRANDVLVVANVNAIDPKGDLTITGYVMAPGDYPFAEHTTVEDLILLAGGLAEGASNAKVDVARRIDDPGSTSASDALAEVFTLTIKDGLFDDGSEGFELKPYDVVSVRKSPSYVEQHNVTITGEVTFPGQYTLTNTSERVSQLVARAGGATPNGNVRGAMLKRRINKYERNVRTAMDRLVAQSVSSRDSLDVNKISIDDVYTVGLELDKALSRPGSDYDIVLRDGDELIIPEMTSTVRIQGEVLYPNTVHYISGKPVSYYVEQAGGYTTRARKAKVYVVYMNGTVAVGSGAKLEPGCEIIVPSKAEKEKLTTAEWLGIGTTAASISTMIATIVSLFINK